MGGEGNGERLAKEDKPLVIRWISSGDLIHSLVIIVNNTVLYTCQLLQVDLKGTHH